MIRLSNFASIFCAIFIAGNMVALSCTRLDRRDADTTVSSTSQESASLMKSDIETIAQGTQSDVEQPFVALIRESTLYDELRKTVSGLPQRDAESFKKTAIIAAFLGERRTAGYGVSISQTSDGTLKLTEAVPQKGAMLAQVITSPFKIFTVSLPNPDAPVVLELASPWKAGGRTFNLTTGEFTVVGGLDAHKKVYKLQGSLNVQRLGNLVSLVFDIRAGAAKKPGLLRTIATGIIEKGTKINLPLFDAGTIIDRSQQFLSASGALSSDGSTLSITLQSIADRKVGDGVVVHGSLDARARP